ncbi:MAG: PAS domain-containing protein [Candidatus Aminicenantes bacterium]|nr:PAS domain-containing protein [Candidatus Aminicenantes bacterium]NIM84009.1 PAS domain-containing protein [Candidatus Aminicenantes bacterium]NIN23487.1 PAS domain-containing protein [Candidatus Aminicenantes bacterium]NIN47192.1 PAS domain-containing protein [Candidatus Aminicenantes bacterium]NIN90116.1 PAS domain-containing protein [Candidatus Aminicenantes bacterium]
MVIDGDRHETSKEDIDFKDFVENLPVGIYQVNNEGKFVYCNKAMADILGFSNSRELIGKKIKDFYFNPADRERLINKMRKEKGRFLDETLHWKTRQNKEIYLSDSCQSIYDGNGKEVGVRGVLVEVWYRKSFDEMNEGIYLIGSDHETIAKVNHAVARMFGYNHPEELEGLKINKFYKNPEDIKKFRDMLFSEGRLENYPIEMVKKDREEFVISVNASLIKDEDGKIIGREGTFREITEEYKIRKILEDMPTGAYQVKRKDGKDRLSYCNKAFAEMFGYSTEEVIEKEARVFHADEIVLNKFKNKLKQADEKGGSLLDYRLHVKKKTGERFWVDIDSQMLKDHKGSIIGRQGTLRDVTIKAQLEYIIRRREDIQRFSHRFMAPIMSIKSSSDTLAEEVRESIKGKPLEDSSKVLKESQGDAFYLLKTIKNLSKEFLNILEELIKSKEGNIISQLSQFTQELREYSNEYRIDDIIELRETHRKIKNCLTGNFASKPNNQATREDFRQVLDYIEMLDKFYILYIVQTITNTSKIAYTEVENLRSYLSGWDQDKKRRNEPYKYRRVNLSECIKEVVNIYQIYAFEKGISTDISVDPFLRIAVSREDFLKMLHNLVQNAVKYSYTRRGNIRIRVEKFAKNIEIEIENYGVGILPDEIESGKIYEYGYRGKLSYDWNRTGSGIGLSEALKIAKKHGGNISITSKPVEDPKGEEKKPYLTRVKVRLPRYHD